LLEKVWRTLKEVSRFPTHFASQNTKSDKGWTFARKKVTIIKKAAKIDSFFRLDL
jgi:hypothetical protein